MLSPFPLLIGFDGWFEDSTARGSDICVGSWLSGSREQVSMTFYFG